MTDFRKTVETGVDPRLLGMAMSNVASEKNREMLFNGNVFYKQ